ncbi:hypothetical protein DPZ16_35060 [Klebsiella pneumoniae]|nr:hypothetical protein DPZ16_35060 [Klebsiella pneumoniae]
MRTRFSLRLSPFTSFPFSQARKHNWPEYSLWDHGPTCGNLKIKLHTLRNFANFTQHASFRSQ